MVIEFLKKKQERIEDVELDIKKLKEQIAREKAWTLNARRKSALLESQNFARSQLFAERQRLKKDVKEYKKHHSKLGKAELAVQSAYHKTEKWVASPQGKKTLKAIDRFFGGK